MPSKVTVRLFDRTTPPHILTLVLLAGIGAMSMSAFLPSLPRMAVYFSTDYEIMQLSVSLYLAVSAVLQLFIGPISDRYGRRPVALASIAIFVVASVGCIYATTIETFLVFRMIQATAAVGFVVSRAIVRDMVPQDEAASMIGYVTMGMALVPMIAPMIGGTLDGAFGWQATFWFLAAAGVGVWVVCLTDLGETATGEGKSFVAQFRGYPELLTSRRFWGYVFCAAFASGAFFAFLGGAPFVASKVYGLSSFWSGVGFGAPAIGYLVGNGLSGRYSIRFGINWMIRAGALAIVGGLSLAFVVTALGMGSAFVFFAFCTFIGLGNGLVIPNASAGMLSVRPHLAGTASGLGAAIMVGGGAGLSVFAGIALSWGGGSLPLLAIMAVSGTMALISIQYVVAREKSLNAG